MPLSSMQNERERIRAWRILTVLAALVFFMLVVQAGQAYVATRTNEKLNHLQDVNDQLTHQAALTRCATNQISNYNQDQWTTVWAAFNSAFVNNDPDVGVQIAAARQTGKGAKGEPYSDRIMRECAKELAAVSGDKK